MAADEAGPDGTRPGSTAAAGGTGRSGRRGFFGRFVGEGLVLAQEALGRGRIRLNELAQLPDERLGLLRPRLRPGWQLRVSSPAVLAVHADGRRRVACAQPTDEDRMVLLCLGPRLTLAGLARQVAAQLDTPWPQTFACVRGHFLRLVQQGVCAPAEASLDEQPGAPAGGRR